MRDRRFVAQRRGGTLTRAQHEQLMQWACDCAKHVLPLLGGSVDSRLLSALEVARQWRLGNASVSEARRAALAAIAVANETASETAVAVARAVGHAVATAHMADHSLGPAIYALKAVKSAGGSLDAERRWQEERLPEGVRQLVLTTDKHSYLERA